MSHANAGGVREVDGARRIAIHRDIQPFGDIAAGEDLPALATPGDAYEAVAGGDVQRAGIARIEIEPVDEGVVETGMPPTAAGRSHKNAAGRKLRPNYVALGRHHAGVKRILARDG